MDWEKNRKRKKEKKLCLVLGQCSVLACSNSRAVDFGHINSFSKLTLNFVPDPVLDTGNPEMNKM